MGRRLRACELLEVATLSPRRLGKLERVWEAPEGLGSPRGKSGSDDEDDARKGYCRVRSADPVSAQSSGQCQGKDLSASPFYRWKHCGTGSFAKGMRLGF